MRHYTTIGDPTNSVERTMAFEPRPVVSIAEMMEGCVVTLNYDSPLQTVVTMISGTYFIETTGDGNPITPLMTSPGPLFFWTATENAKCKCRAGAFVTIAELERPKK